MEDAALMKSKKMKKILNEELDEIKEKLNYVICQMQNLQQRIDIEQQEPKLRVSEYDDDYLR